MIISLTFVRIACAGRVGFKNTRKKTKPREEVAVVEKPYSIFFFLLFKKKKKNNILNKKLLESQIKFSLDDS